jgi:hypothetical protein
LLLARSSRLAAYEPAGRSLTEVCRAGRLVDCEVAIWAMRSHLLTRLETQLGIIEAPQTYQRGPQGNLVTGGCRPPLAVVQKGTDADQKRRQRVSFLAEIEEPDSDQNAYHGHGYNFEHGVESGAV